MKKQYAMSLALTIIILLTWLTPHTAAQSVSQTSIVIDGQRVSVPAIWQNGYQLVPASFFRQFNVSVNWSERYRAAVLKTGAIEIGFPAGERFTDYQHAKGTLWQRDYLDTQVTLINGSAYIPLAYTARKIGLHIKYDAQLRAAVISTEVTIKASSNPLSSQADELSSNSKAISNQPSEEELKWLYQITEAEAGGETYDGKVAVAASILNRVEHPDFPSSIIDTIFQVVYIDGRAYYQYSPVLDKRIYKVTPSEKTKRAVHDALNGSDPSLGAVVFYNPEKTDNQWVRSRPFLVQIGNHIFAK